MKKLTDTITLKDISDLNAVRTAFFVGDTDKHWVKYSGQKYLFKKRIANSMSSVGEVVASVIAEKLGIQCVDACFAKEIINGKKYNGALIKSFRTKGVYDVVSLETVLASYYKKKNKKENFKTARVATTVEEAMEAIKSTYGDRFTIEPDTRNKLLSIALFDYLFVQTDRGYYNIDLLFCSQGHGEKIIKLAPMYDNEACLRMNFSENAIAQYLIGKGHSMHCLGLKNFKEDPIEFYGDAKMLPPLFIAGNRPNESHIKMYEENMARMEIHRIATDNLAQEICENPALRKLLWHAIYSINLAEIFYEVEKNGKVKIPMSHKIIAEKLYGEKKDILLEKVYEIQEERNHASVEKEINTFEKTLVSKYNKTSANKIKSLFEISADELHLKFPEYENFKKISEEWLEKRSFDDCPKVKDFLATQQALAFEVAATVDKPIKE